MTHKIVLLKVSFKNPRENLNTYHKEPVPHVFMKHDNYKKKSLLKRHAKLCLAVSLLEFVAYVVFNTS